MRKLIYLMLGMILFLTSCKTKQITASKSEDVQISERTIESDSTAKITAKKSYYNFNESLSSSESLLQKLGLTYSGTSNDDKASVIVNQSDQGLSVDISGAFKMALEQSKDKNETLTQETIVNLLDSVIDAKLMLKKDERSEQLLSSFEKNKVSETKGLQFGAYLTGFGVVCFVLLLMWLGWRFKVIDRIKII